MTTVKKDDKVEAALKAAYKTKKYGVTGTFGSAGLVRTLKPTFAAALSCPSHCTS